MTSAMKTFTQARTSRKRKRDEMSESESSDQEDPNDPEMAGNSPGDISSQVNDLLQSTESVEKYMRNMRNTTDQRIVKILYIQE